MGTFLKSKKGIITFICSAVVIAAAVVVGVIFLGGGEEAYRTIVVAGVEGTALVSNETAKDTPAYSGMALYDGDTASVGAESTLTMEFDGDKYMMAQAGTVFSLEASGKPGSDKTVINLKSGAALVRVKNKLGDGQSYVVNTPTATIAVRGTVYYIAISENEEGKTVVTCTAFDGQVEVTPIDENGTPTQESAIIPAGYAASVIEILPHENGGVQSSQFLITGDGPLEEIEDYSLLPLDVIEELVEYIDDGEELCALKEELLALLQAHEHTYSREWTYDETGHWHQSDCGHEEVLRADEEPHEFDGGTVTMPAAHTAAGLLIYTCTDCGYAVSEVIPATPDHEWGGWTPGQDGHTRTCPCGEDDSAAHTWDGGELIEATDDTPAGTVYTCTDCGAVNFVAHVWDGGTVTAEAAHTSPGEMTYTCTLCGHAVTEVIPETPDHEWSETAEETDGGHIRTCPCGETLEEEHTWDEGVPVPADEEHDEGRLHTCTVCGSWHVDSHSWDGGVVTAEASHTAQGEMTSTCLTCGHVKTEVIPMVSEHLWPDWTADSTGHSRACVCGESEEGRHTWNSGEVTAEATHTEPGTRTFTCTVCGFERTEDIDMLPDHVWTAWALYPRNEAQHVRSCPCGADEREYHTWDGGVIAVMPTDDTEGLAVYTCTVCGHTESTVLDKLHTHQWDEWVPADDMEHHNRYCTCDEVDSAPHDWGEGVPELNEDGILSLYYMCSVCGYSKYEEYPHDHIYLADADPFSDTEIRLVCVVCYNPVYHEIHECYAATDSYVHNDTHHWAVCGFEGCPGVADYTEHGYEGQVVSNATADQPGLYIEACVCGAEDAAAAVEYEFEAIIAVFDAACGQPGWDTYDRNYGNTLVIGDAFDYAAVKVYGVYSESFDGGGIMLDANGIPVSGRLLSPSEYTFDFRYAASLDAGVDMQSSDAAACHEQGLHSVDVRYTGVCPPMWELSWNYTYTAVLHADHSVAYRRVDDDNHEVYCADTQCLYTPVSASHGWEVITATTEEHTRQCTDCGAQVTDTHTYIADSCSHAAVADTVNATEVNGHISCTYCGEISIAVPLYHFIDLKLFTVAGPVAVNVLCPFDDQVVNTHNVTQTGPDQFTCEICRQLSANQYGVVGGGT